MIRNLTSTMTAHISNNTLLQLARETTKLLNARQEDLAFAKWADGESNTDTDFSTLACSCCEQAWETIKIQTPEFKEISLKCNIPDINLRFIDEGLRTLHNAKIELKSSKSKNMPGSTIQKLDINMPLIYCLRPATITENSVFHVRCSQYFQAMGEGTYDLFQDRTPRPGISFEKMTDIDVDVEGEYKEKEKNIWIHHYAQCALNRLDGSYQGKHSWQDDMVKQIQQLTIADFLKNTSTEQFIELKKHIISA